MLYDPSPPLLSPGKLTPDLLDLFKTAYRVAGPLVEIVRPRHSIADHICQLFRILPVYSVSADLSPILCQALPRPKEMGRAMSGF
ncbi:hypothetical protein [Ovoidimarina sediminis]|uniref:hypothetical protein n=1 Tax=Ovoidimarina sediminis TaxID=3079856 RepID=UPI002908CC00|nr:hypothetical protein [Rhodophyticola sp. MJ-SS7]MDU8944093.1 hypothetical protein [Rhodophyticola sp. MJ-SS7]